MDANKLGSAGGDVPLTFAGGTKPTLTARAGMQPKNRLLAGLPRHVLSSLGPQLKPVCLARGSVLCDADEPLKRIYFIEAGAVSLVTVFKDGSIAEMATVGREGLAGVGILLRSEYPLGRYVVAMPGLALAVEASEFLEALQDSPELRAACEAYTRAFLREALQSAACNSVHLVEERCARWLLMSHDRSDGDTVALTQVYLAEMLGVCRSTVTVALGVLQRAGIIHCRRGVIRVLDRRGLEEAACECYQVIRDQYERLHPRRHAGHLSLVDGPHLTPTSI